jgi:hypothetical protein
MAKQTKVVKMNEARHMVITPIARVSFPSVFKARSFQDVEGATKSFQVDLIFDEAQLSEEYKGKKRQTVSLKKAVFNAKVDQWGANKDKWPDFAHPVFKKGDKRKNKDGEVYQGYEGKIFITAKCGEKYPPKVILADGSPADEKSFYGGCYARAQLIARPYDFGGNRGVRFLLLQLMKVEDGERFGGIADDVFDVEEMGDAIESDADSSDEEDGDDF